MATKKVPKAKGGKKTITAKRAGKLASKLSTAKEVLSYDAKRKANPNTFRTPTGHVGSPKKAAKTIKKIGRKTGPTGRLRGFKSIINP